MELKSLKEQKKALCQKLEHHTLIRDQYQVLLHLAQIKSQYADDVTLFSRGCRCLKRLGLYREGLYFAKFNQILGEKMHEQSSPMVHIQLLWSALFLLNLGLHQYAKQLLQYVQINSVGDSLLMAELHHTLSDYPSAEKFFRDYFQMKGILEPNSESIEYLDKIHWLNYADIIASQNNFEPATQILNQIRASSSELQLQGLIWLKKGEFLLRQRKMPQEALLKLTQAQNLLNSNDQSFDYFLLMKWICVAYVQMNDTLQAHNYYQKASALVRVGRWRTEIMLDLELILSEFKISSPESFQKMLHYPNLTDPIKNRISRKLNSSSDYSVCAYAEQPVSLIIYLKSNEFRWVHQNHAHTKIPMELELAAYVLLFQNEGLTKDRIIEFFWPGEVFSFLQLDHRLNQLLNRLRNKYQINISIENRYLVMDTKSINYEVIICSNSLPLFVKLHSRGNPIKLQELDAFYNIRSRTTRSELIKKWQNLGHLKEIGS